MPFALYRSCLVLPATFVLLLVCLSWAPLIAQDKDIFNAIRLNDIETIKALAANDKQILNKQAGGLTPLLAAITARKNEMVQVLLDEGADVDAPGHNGQTPLLYALNRRNDKLAELVIAAGADVNKPDKNGTTPLMYAMMYRRDTPLVKKLIEKGADLSRKNANGMSVLQMACSYRRPDLVIFLLEQGATPNVKDNMGATPFLTASGSGMLKALKLMVELGVDPVQYNRHKQSSLHLASQSGSLETVEFLLNHYDDVNELDQFGSSPLVYGTYSNKEPVVKLLIEKGAKTDVDTLRPGALPPLLHASSIGSKHIVAVLLAGGADPDRIDSEGNTSLHLAAYGSGGGFNSDPNRSFADDYVEIIERLLASKANANIKNKLEQTPIAIAAGNEFYEGVEALVDHVDELDISIGSDSLLHWVSQYGMSKTAQRIVKSGVDVNSLNAQQQTPLHIAAEFGKPEVAKVLCENNANIKALDQFGQSPLHVASAGGHAAVVEQLVERGCEVNRVDSSGRSALHYAAWGGWPKLVRGLIAAGAKPDVATESGYTPLHAAAWQGHAGIIRRLVMNGGNVDAADSDGWTPLHKAAYRSQVDAVKMLMNQKANRDAKNLSGMTAMELAKSQNHDAVVELLSR